MDGLNVLNTTGGGGEVRRVLVIEVTVKQPFDDEMETAYLAADDERRAESVTHMAEEAAKWAREWVDEGDGAEVVANIRIEEEADE